MEPGFYNALFRKYLENDCSPDEVDQLLSFLKNEANEHVAGELIEQHLTANSINYLPVDTALRQRLEARLQFILENDQGRETTASEPTVHRIHFGRLRRWMAAAAVILLLGAGAWFWLDRAHKADYAKEKKQADHIVNDALPGGNKAILTLADNSRIVLDSAANGQLAQQGKTTVIKSGEGKLVYDANALAIDHSPLSYNTLATPRGGQYQLVLPDGSKVWLNAASSIRYPTAFTGNERKVDITGEAYFEVAKDPKKPFIVNIGGGGRVEVLGTHFNINSYEDEARVRTTLLEGAVKVAKDAATAILKPGEQAVIADHSPLTIDHSPDLEQVMAWKNGLFDFSKADIQTVMRQITRWYDVEVVYEGIPKGTFSGGVSRNTNLSNVLKILELSDVKFRIEGRKLIVKP
jgi:transmembrane sensor